MTHNSSAKVDISLDLLHASYQAYMDGEAIFPTIRPNLHPAAIPPVAVHIAELLASEWKKIDTDTAFFGMQLAMCMDVISERSVQQTLFVASKVGRNAIHMAVVRNNGNDAPSVVLSTYGLETFLPDHGLEVAQVLDGHALVAQQPGDSDLAIMRRSIDLTGIFLADDDAGSVAA